MAALRNCGVEFELFLVTGKGAFGYLKNLPLLKKSIAASRCTIVHAHFGLSGMLAVLQRKVPVVITFHGTDIQKLRSNLVSSVASLLSSHNIFVSMPLKTKLLARNRAKYSIVPCGVDTEKFYPMDKFQARKLLGLQRDVSLVLFSSSFDNQIKNYELARKAIMGLSNCVLIEACGRSREEMCLLFNACDILLITSFYESSSQVAKEAMACNCPIVSTDVGIVRELTSGIEGCYITSYAPDDITDKVKRVLEFKGRTRGREKITGMGNEEIAKKVIEIYYRVAIHGRRAIREMSRVRAGVK